MKILVQILIQLTKKKTYFLFSLIFPLSSVLIVFLGNSPKPILAQWGGGGGSGGFGGADNIIDFNKLKRAFPTGSLPAMDNLTIGFLISKAVTYLFIIAGLILLFLLISAGFQMMLGAADPKAKEEASKKITNALVGFLILFVSYWLVQIIEVVLGISILK